MQFDATIEYPASATAVAAMLADPEYVRRKVAASGAASFEHSVSGTAAGAFTVDTTRLMPADMVPERYRKFVGSGINMRFIETWEAADDQGSRPGTLTLNISGAPAKAAGKTRLEATGASSCTITYSGDVKVSIPLVGPSIERAAVNAVTQAVNLERNVGLAWLDRK